MNLPQNQWPNFTNFQEVSFPQEVTPPDVEPDVDMICVQYNPAWSLVLSAALNQLTQLSAWSGTDDEKKLAVNRATNLKIQLLTPTECGMSCCTDVILHRVNPTTGALEISTDGGTTWSPDPESPTSLVTQLPAPVTEGGTNTKCDAAVNGRGHFQDLVAQHDVAFDTAGTAVEFILIVAAAIIAIIFSGGAAIALLPILIGTYTAGYTLGKAAFDAYFTTEVYDDIQCILFCHMESDGTFTQADFEAVLSDFGALLPPGVPRDMIYRDIQAMGVAGLNNMVAYGISTGGDCSDCGCGTCVDHWRLSYPDNDIFGRIVTRSEDEQSITLETVTVNGNGHYYVDIRTPSAEVCCSVLSITEIEGSVAIAAWQDCGATFSDSAFTIGILTGHCVNHIQLNSPAPFTVKVTFEECP